jgi:hypothetical protein
MRLREIDEWAFRDDERSQLFEHRTARGRYKTVSNSRHVDQIASLVILNDDGVESVSTRPEPYWVTNSCPRFTRYLILRHRLLGRRFSVWSLPQGSGNLYCAGGRWRGRTPGRIGPVHACHGWIRRSNNLERGTEVEKQERPLKR